MACPLKGASQGAQLLERIPGKAQVSSSAQGVGTLTGQQGRQGTSPAAATITIPKPLGLGGAGAPVPAKGRRGPELDLGVGAGLGPHGGAVTEYGGVRIDR